MYISTLKDSNDSRSASRTSFITPMVQPKLEIGEADDEYEKEADTMADKVMSMPAPSMTVPEEDEESDDSGFYGEDVYSHILDRHAPFPILL